MVRHQMKTRESECTQLMERCVVAVAAHLRNLDDAEATLFEMSRGGAGEKSAWTTQYSYLRQLSAEVGRLEVTHAILKLMQEVESLGFELIKFIQFLAHRVIWMIFFLFTRTFPPRLSSNSPLATRSLIYTLDLN